MHAQVTQTSSISARSDERQPIAAAKAGDQRAYGELLQRHQTVAFRAAYLVAGSAADAEDATQDACVKAWLALPRFRLKARFELVPALQRLGVTAAFGTEADFSGITAAGQLLISTVAHQAYIDVNEQGTEAAAATAVVMGRSAAFRAPPSATMVVDRPFLFAIRDNAPGVTGFLGQVSQPRSS